MPIDYGQESGNYFKLPKVGETSKEIKIISGERVEDKDYKFNFTKRETVELEGGGTAQVEVNQGFRYVFTLESGEKLTLSSWKPFYAFKEADVQEGDTIKIFHPEKGVWRVEKIKREPQVNNDNAWDQD